MNRNPHSLESYKVGDRIIVREIGSDPSGIICNRVENMGLKKLVGRTGHVVAVGQDAAHYCYSGELAVDYSGEQDLDSAVWYLRPELDEIEFVKSWDDYSEWEKAQHPQGNPTLGNPVYKWGAEYDTAVQIETYPDATLPDADGNPMVLIFSTIPDGEYDIFGGEGYMYPKDLYDNRIDALYAANRGINEEIAKLLKKREENNKEIVAELLRFEDAE